MLLEDYQDELQEEIDAGTIKAMVDDVDGDEKKRLIDQLIDYRQLKWCGMRAMNKAALVDRRQTASRIGDTVSCPSCPQFFFG